MLPWPGWLRNWISPPSSDASSRLIASPRPVPPYLRLVLASACWNASKMIRCLTCGMPIPVSATTKATTSEAWLSTGCDGDQPSRGDEIVSDTPPCAVNLNAFDSRLRSTCCTRLASVIMAPPRSAATSAWNHKPRRSASCLNVRLMTSTSVANCTSLGSTVTVPDSIFERSSMSLIRLSRSVPAL